MNISGGDRDGGMSRDARQCPSIASGFAETSQEGVAECVKDKWTDRSQLLLFRLVVGGPESTCVLILQT